jgi:hypothetical protein
MNYLKIRDGLELQSQRNYGRRTVIMSQQYNKGIKRKRRRRYLERRKQLRKQGAKPAASAAAKGE